MRGGARNDRSDGATGRWGRFFRILRPTYRYIPPVVLYYSFLSGLPVRYPFPWVGVLAIYLAYIVAERFLSRGERLSPAFGIFAAGLLIAGLTDAVGLRWLHMAYIPFVLVVGMYLSVKDLMFALLCVPFFEASHILGTGFLMSPDSTVGEEIFEDLALIAFTALGGTLAYVFRRRAGAEGTEPRASARHPAIAPQLSSSPQPSLISPADDREIGDILSVIALTVSPSAASLFLIEGGELSCAVSSAGRVGLLGSGAIFDALQSKLPVRAVTAAGEFSAGYEHDGTIAEVLGVPVLDGGVALGVLAIDAAEEGRFTEREEKALALFASQVMRVLAMRRVRAVTEQESEWLKIVHGESARLVASLDVSAIVSTLLGGMLRVAPLHATVFLAEGDGFAAVARDGLSLARGEKVSLSGTLADMAVTDREMKYFSNLRGYRVPVLPGRGHDDLSALVLPLICQEEVLGLVALTSRAPDTLTPRQIDTLGVLVNQTAISLKNAQMHEEMKRRAVTDGLTGLTNHRHFVELLDKEFKLYRRTRKPFSLLLVDVDFFKKVNDTFGHPVGDIVLRGVAGVIKAAVREIDIAARYGGEEFVSVLVDTPAAGARKLAERVRKSIAETAHEAEGSSITVTVSIGVATCPDDSEEMPALVEMADKALYKAKNDGRNRVVSWNDVMKERIPNQRKEVRPDRRA